MNKNKVKLLKMLYSNQGEYISGEKISQDLGVSRTTIWKYIKELREKGYKIDSRSNRGYSLIEPATKIVPEEVLLDLDTEFIGREICFFPEVGSTNEKAKELARNGAEVGTVVIAEEQKTGKGRLGRNWYSPPGTGLWFSIVLRPDFTPEKAPFLTIVASLAVALALEGISLSPGIKWPNDILVDNKKVCGILSELSADLGKINYAIVGTGINVNQNEFPEQLKDKATSLQIASGSNINRIELLQDILSYFEDFYKRLLQGQEEDLLKIWKERLNIIGKEINIYSNEKLYQGIAVDISARGELMIEDESGDILSFWAGDASLNKGKNS